MTTQTPNTMPYEQSADGVGYDALQVSALVGETLPENKVITLEQTLDKLSASTSYNEQYRTALLDGDVKAAGHALKDFYLSTQIAQVAAEHPLTEQTRQEMSELDAANQRAFILENLEQLRDIFNENGERFVQLWKEFKPTRLDVREINKSAKLKKLMPELIAVADTLRIIRRIAQQYAGVRLAQVGLAHPFLVGCAFPVNYQQNITGVVPFQPYTSPGDLTGRQQATLNTAREFALMLQNEPQAGREVTLKWCTADELEAQETEYERMIQELGLRKLTPNVPQGVLNLEGKEIEIYKYWVAQQ